MTYRITLVLAGGYSLSVEYQGQVDKAKMAITPASILRAETGKEGER